MIRVAVVGASGYTGIELVRWVLSHPEVTLTHVTSASDAGRALSEVYPAVVGHTDLRLAVPDLDAIANLADVVFLAVPHTAALAMAPELLRRGSTVIDLSADFRLEDAAVYEEWYGVTHTASDLLGEAVYGLPELDRSRLPGARLVACPGCYPTASLLAALPALRTGMAAGSRMIVDAKSGVSGAGRSLSAAAHYCSANESLAPYKVATHRHVPEIEQSFSRAAGRPCSVVFAPHLVPMTRGLLATVYMDAGEGVTAASVQSAYEQMYAEEPFVTVCPAGSMPSTSLVRGTNRASIGVAMDERAGTIIAACAIDNLGKGASGQAVQCLNAVLGFPETTGLTGIGAVI